MMHKVTVTMTAFIQGKDEEDAKNNLCKLLEQFIEEKMASARASYIIGKEDK